MAQSTTIAPVRDAPLADDVEDVRVGEVAAWILRPEEPPRTAVLMAHGFSMTRHDGLLPYARALRDAGHLVVAFDHRHLGDSGGERRQRFRPAEQRADWLAVADRLRRAEPALAGRIVLWGFSFSGGHVVRLAREMPGVVASLVLCPFLDGFARVLSTPLSTSAWILPQALADLAGSHRTIPVTGPPGSRGAMTLPGEAEGFAASAAASPFGSPWQDAISPGVFATVAMHRPNRHAARITTPIWVGLGERDVSVSNAAVRELARKAPRGELHTYDVDHFEPFYDPEAIRTISADQVAFLERVLPKD
ncbi:alpha/beta hydrolase [Patulibacter sp.]|uniref:alpha/beta hydrolase n=1 Tax=Patulibacter sp. TaxID=1912859 RepID=UPI0027175F29|nr:alpha/beta fold hydrolase [Patulibacter sp.]MDO9409546.1 alpha/beta fold hydrolase [Patulibacter sp.]